MTSLGCFKDKEKLLRDLLCTNHNTEKVIYFLLLDRKRRRPCFEDETESIIRNRSESADPPRKRVDVRPGGSSTPKPTPEILADGSPITPRRFPYGINSSTKVYINCTPIHRRNANRRTNGATNNLLVSPINSPKPHRTGNPEELMDTPPGSPLSQPYWKSRLNTLKNSFLGSPRFHRRKLQVPLYDDNMGLTPESSPELTKRSWFGSLMGTERDETHVILIKDRQLSAIKADLIHAFLSISDLSHSVLSPMSFRVEFKRPGSTAMFQRNVRFHVDITCATPPADNATNGSIDKTTDKPTIYCITFTLISGPLRRFKRICDHIQAQVLGSRRAGGQHSPRMGRRPTRELSDTSSCGSCGSDSLSPTPTRLHVSEDTVSLAAAVVNTSTTNLTAAISRCKSDQDAAKDIFEREAKLLADRRQESTHRLINNLTNGRRLSLEPKLQTDKV
ncbi:unnamed protein product [Oppiella nova]|nr:unnamed protein product [Oppiella nova]CAG2163308.1 unnamed protein product [Oppiella nova]